MIDWRIKTSEKPATNKYWSESITAWSREDSGFFAMNVSKESIRIEIATDLPAGSYCNVLAPECQEFKVSELGTVDLLLPPQTAIALLR
jgi:hypothetical protein